MVGMSDLVLNIVGIYLCQVVKDLYVCRCHPRILLRSSDEGVCRRSDWSITVASRLLQLPCSHVCSGKKVTVGAGLRLAMTDINLS